MRHLFMVSLLALLFLLVFSMPGQACINDREVEHSEREFKSQYRAKPSVESASPDGDNQNETGQGRTLAAVTVGLALMAGAAGLGLAKTS
jgi:hypothetical protein